MLAPCNGHAGCPFTVLAFLSGSNLEWNHNETQITRCKPVANGPDLFSGFTLLDPPRSATLGAVLRATTDGLQYVRGYMVWPLADDEMAVCCASHAAGYESNP